MANAALSTHWFKVRLFRLDKSVCLHKGPVCMPPHPSSVNNMLTSIVGDMQFNTWPAGFVPPRAAHLPDLPNTAAGSPSPCCHEQNTRLAAPPASDSQSRHRKGKRDAYRRYRRYTVALLTSFSRSSLITSQRILSLIGPRNHGRVVFCYSASNWTSSPHPLAP